MIKYEITYKENQKENCSDFLDKCTKIGIEDKSVLMSAQKYFSIFETVDKMPVILETFKNDNKIENIIFKEI